MVSICIPAYNNEAFLQRLIRSIEIQTYSNYEVIITDDSDREEIKDYVYSCDLKEKIKYYKNKKRLGATLNCNQAILYACGDYIKMMHHDDYFASAQSLEKMVALLEGTNAEIIFTGTWQISEKNRISRCISLRDAACLRKDPYYLYSANCIGGPSATMWRNHGFFFDEKLEWLVDIDLYIRILERNQDVVYTEEPLICIGIHDDQLTNSCIDDSDINMGEYTYLYKKYKLKSNMRATKTFINTLKSFSNLSNDYIKEAGLSKVYYCFFRTVDEILRVLRYIKRHMNHERVKEWMLINKILRTYRNSDDMEIIEVLDHIKRNRKLTYFNYDWFNMDKQCIVLEYDEQLNRNYYIFEGHRMYFKKSWTTEQIKQYLLTLLPEQDRRSPHLYFDDKMKDEHYNIVIDAGGAEGMFALSVIDRCNAIYILECDDDWAEALTQTFSTYKEKVHIINKYLSDYTDNNHITLDDLVQDYKSVSMIKLDIEGAEVKALHGGRNIFSSCKDIQLLVCVYHYQEEEHEVRKELEEYNFAIENRNGFIFFLHDACQKYPYFRRGVLKISGEKQKNLSEL